MNLRPRPQLVAAAVVASALACGGGGGGGGGPSDPGHQPSAEQAVKLSGMGDSMMQGMDTSCTTQSGGSIGAEHPLCSFAQGTDETVFSLFSRYKVVSGLSGGQEFVSESGAAMIGDAASQASRICAQSSKPNRIVIMLGANDVCNAGSVASLPTAASFGAGLQAALGELGSAACGLPSGSRVHVISVPRVDLLRQAGLAKDAAAGNTRCQAIYGYGILCPIVTAGTDGDREAVATRIAEYNDGIAAEVDAANGLYAASGIQFSTDWKGASTPSIGTFVFGAEDVSEIDCFHPSATGQRRLACGAWESWEGLGNPDACQ